MAGLELRGSSFGPWIRPVSDRPKRELDYQERRCIDGGDVEVLDVVRVPLTRAVPEDYQTENHVVDTTCFWQREGRLGWNDIELAVETVRGPLWVNGYFSSKGNNDRVPARLARSFKRSLYFVRPSILFLGVREERNVRSGDQPQVRAIFKLSGHWYNLAVTDPEVEEELLGRGEGVFPIKSPAITVSLPASPGSDEEVEAFPIQDALITVSLGELLGGFAYKLVAAVITPERAESEELR